MKAMTHQMDSDVISLMQKIREFMDFFEAQRIRSTIARNTIAEMLAKADKTQNFEEVESFIEKNYSKIQDGKK